ncbi:methyl-accepting chemotaxis protein [Desulfonema magnum]|uniref:Methyl-accepting chemotaxis protein signailing-domain containing protein, HAMP domain-containing n=1 Tax=Desulfonema magnum TaxID=45655 RepID=A0A975GNX5_9BACT|nr:methyl-accepting chemotaxis protein [Desulfonema magnum]QTA88421.1 Methyl-accepting chemotaxis protein signailing-domain containing protein, HAMP domain-containing [Desulfonema magnum]
MKKKRIQSLFVKLMSGFVSITLLFLLFSLYAVTQLGAVGGYFDKAYNEAVVPMEKWAQFKIRLGDIKSLLNRHISEWNLEVQQKIESELSEKFKSADELLKKLGADMLSEDEIARIEQEHKNGEDHSIGNFREESLSKIMVLVKFHHDEFKAVSGEVIEHSKNFMKEDASAILNTGAGLEIAIFMDKITSEILDRMRYRVADYRDQSLKLRRQVQLYLIIGSAFAVFIALLISYFFARSITGPVRLVLAGLRDIAEGEGNLTKRLDIYTKDEVGELARWFNIFAENLQTMMKEIADTTYNLSKASDKMSAVSVNMTSSAQDVNSQAITAAAASEQVNTNVSMVASAAAQSSSSLSNIASMTEEISSVFDNIAGLGKKTADNMTRMAQSNEDIANQVNSIAISTEEMTASLNEVAKNTARANRVSQDTNQRAEQIKARMDALESSSKQIGRIVGIIKDIADQTNMLALNATIEAAGAGEAGKGFAVVAGEVKELAKQSAEASDEIAGQIDEIQKSVRDAGQAVQDINKTINEVAGINEMIASSAEEQTATASEISKSVASTAGTVRTVTESASESANLVGEIASSTDETSKTLREIAQNTDELLNNVKAVARSSDEAARGVDDIFKYIKGISTSSEQTALGASQANDASEKLAKTASALAQIISRFKLSELKSEN